MAYNVGMGEVATCEICGELYESNNNANTALAVIEGNKITHLYCAQCFIDKIKEHLAEKVDDIVSDNGLIS